MTSELIILTVMVAVMLILLSILGALCYWLKKRIDRVGQATNHTEQTDRSVPSNFDHQTAPTRGCHVDVRHTHDWSRRFSDCSGWFHQIFARR